MKINQSAVDKARDLIIKGRYDGGPWLPFENIDEAGALAGEDDTRTIAEAYGVFFLGVDGTGDNTEDFAYPYARVVYTEEPQVFVEALRIIRIQAGIMGHAEVFRAANELLALATGNQMSSEFAAGDVEGLDPEGWWVEVFRSGTWTGSSGGTNTYTDSDIDKVVGSFNETFPKVKPVLRLGDHPSASDGLKPAVGWVTALKREGSKMLAYFTSVPGVVRDAIEKKLYKNVSVGLWPNFPVDGKVHDLVLNHIAILGAELPAVSGLADLQAYMKSGQVVPDSVVCLTQADVSQGGNMPTIEELQAELAETNEKLSTATAELTKVKGENDSLKTKVQEFSDAKVKSEVETVVDDAVKSQRLLPKDRDDAVEIGLALRTASVELKDGESSAYDRWQSQLKNADKIVDFSDKASTGSTDSDSKTEFEQDFARGVEAVSALDK